MRLKKQGVLHIVTCELRMMFAPEMWKRKEPMSCITREKLPHLYCSINVSVLYMKKDNDKNKCLEGGREDGRRSHMSHKNND